MKNTLLLLAGYPATGKTYMCRRILARFPKFEVLSQDLIKEKIWDEYGFHNLDEKKKTEQIAWEQYYSLLECKLKNKCNIISDYPFSDKQKDRLKKIAQDTGTCVVTIRLVGDLEILYQRSLKRDLDQSRHLGHLVSSYHKGDTMKERKKADELVVRDIFMDRCLNRGYNLFELGDLIEVDVTDFNKIDYEKIMDNLAEYMEET